MPIEIKELHIKINVNDEATRQGANGEDSNQKEEIIEACVEQIMEILSKKEER